MKYSEGKCIGLALKKFSVGTCISKQLKNSLMSFAVVRLCGSKGSETVSEEVLSCCKVQTEVNSDMHPSEEGICQVMEMRKGTLNIGNY